MAVCLTPENPVERDQLGGIEQPHPPQGPVICKTYPPFLAALAVLFTAAGPGFAAPALAGNSWSSTDQPTLGPARVIGSYGAGCIAGAVALPLTGEGYRVMRPSRNRYYGHPDLIAFVHNLARHTALRGRNLLIGDLGQPRGGPMPSGHRSHQSGLDVDVWFRQQPAHKALSPRDIEDTTPPSMIRAAAGVPDPALWSGPQADALKVAALAPEVERIFINPILKRALCASETERAWLRKVRPWWGHDQHFHVRLACPAGDTQCEPQKPIPPGDGCDADLDRWVEDIRRAALSPKVFSAPPPPSPDKLPAACATVLHGPAAAAHPTAPPSTAAAPPVPID
ncbi:MAG: penicillin-insensitive murein endopeptidase [Rhodocyclaceae bacterium]